MIIKRSVAITFLVAFLLLSYIYISPYSKDVTSEYSSYELSERTVSESNQKRIDYIDDRGNITVALDMGYSTRTIQNNTGVTIESYYDPSGNPVMCVDGYYSKKTEFNENNESVYITYLDNNNDPVMIPAGYAREKNIYNEQGKKEKVLYYDELNNPICSIEGFGKKYEYNEEGRIKQITYLDEFGNPMITDNGYAIVLRSFYSSDGPENGKIEKEFYFDTQGEPIALRLGQYGIYHIYNEAGENTGLTYLDANGNPMETKKGYSTIIREYQGSSYTEKYYDINGRPYRLAEGQYGTKKEKGRTTYINSEGKEQLNIKLLLYNQPRIIIFITLIILIVSANVDKRTNILLCIIYFVAIIYMTLLYRESGSSTNNLEVLSAYKRILIDDEVRSGIIKNIWLFIPLGGILYRICANKKVLIIPLFLSLLIELFQYFTNTGWCELDDVINNTLGGLIGFISTSFILNIKHRIVVSNNGILMR